jgi:hypothetical protein
MRLVHACILIAVASVTAASAGAPPPGAPLDTITRFVRALDIMRAPPELERELTRWYDGYHEGEIEMIESLLDDFSIDSRPFIDSMLSLIVDHGQCVEIWERAIARRHCVGGRDLTAATRSAINRAFRALARRRVARPESWIVLRVKSRDRRDVVGVVGLVADRIAIVETGSDEELAERFSTSAISSYKWPPAPYFCALGYCIDRYSATLGTPDAELRWNLLEYFLRRNEGESRAVYEMHHYPSDASLDAR